MEHHSIVFYSHMCLRRNALKLSSKGDLRYDDSLSYTKPVHHSSSSGKKPCR